MGVRRRLRAFLYKENGKWKTLVEPQMEVREFDSYKQAMQVNKYLLRRTVIREKSYDK